MGDGPRSTNVNRSTDPQNRHELVRLPPEETVVDLLRLNQVFELPETSERFGLKGRSGHLDSFKQFAELLSPFPGISATTKFGEPLANLVEGHTITAIVSLI